MLESACRPLLEWTGHYKLGAPGRRICRVSSSISWTMTWIWQLKTYLQRKIPQISATTWAARLDESHSRPCRAYHWNNSCPKLKPIEYSPKIAVKLPQCRISAPFAEFCRILTDWESIWNHHLPIGIGKSFISHYAIPVVQNINASTARNSSCRSFASLRCFRPVRKSPLNLSSIILRKIILLFGDTYRRYHNLSNWTAPNWYRIGNRKIFYISNRPLRFFFIRDGDAFEEIWWHVPVEWKRVASEGSEGIIIDLLGLSESTAPGIWNKYFGHVFPLTPRYTTYTYYKPSLCKI